MQGFYNITQRIKLQLEDDPIVSNVTFGDIFDIDLSKQSIFPLCHMVVNQATLEGNIWRFNLTVYAMDVLDISQEDTTDKFLKNSNEQDILNTQLAVLNRLFEVLRVGILNKELYQLDGNPTCENFTERFENNLSGWAGTFDVLIPNQMTSCEGLPDPAPSCSPGSYIIKDQDGNTLETGTIASGGTETIIIQVSNDITYTITNSIGGILYTATTENDFTQAITDSVATLKDTAGTVISNTNILAQGSQDIEAPDGSVAVNGNAYDTVVSGGALEIPVVNTVADPVGTIIVGGVLVGNTQIEVNSVNEGSIPSEQTLDIQLTDGTNPVVPDDINLTGDTLILTLPASAPAISTATLMKTGQTTSYRTGDDGDLEAGRGASFLVLGENNPFGNTNRFTDELGGQTYTNNIVIDWSTYNGSTVLGWDRRRNGGGANVDVQWNAAIDAALTHSVGGFSSGWRLPNRKEADSLTDNSISSWATYSPMNIPNENGYYWTGTTNNASTTQAFAMTRNSTAIENVSKTAAFQPRWIACRVFTVTGTTLS